MKKQKNPYEELAFENAMQQEIVFPIYYKNRRGNIYTCLQNEEKFEQISISQENESFRFNILGGFNEQLKLYKDIKLMYAAILRVNKLITSDEYESVFNAILEGRQEFFSNTDEEKYKYIEPIHPLNQDELNKYIKHRWRPVTY